MKVVLSTPWAIRLRQIYFATNCGGLIRPPVVRWKAHKKFTQASFFQDFALFPWLSVYEISNRLKMHGLAQQERHKRTSYEVERMGLKGFEKNFRTELSGGMKQRSGRGESTGHKSLI